MSLQYSSSRYLVSILILGRVSEYLKFFPELVVSPGKRMEARNKGTKSEGSWEHLSLRIPKVFAWLITGRRRVYINIKELAGVEISTHRGLK
jgi:hypothetical protein